MTNGNNNNNNDEPKKEKVLQKIKSKASELRESLQEDRRRIAIRKEQNRIRQVQKLKKRSERLSKQKEVLTERKKVQTLQREIREARRPPQSKRRPATQMGFGSTGQEFGIGFGSGLGQAIITQPPQRKKKTPKQPKSQFDDPMFGLRIEGFGQQRKPRKGKKRRRTKRSFSII